MDMENFCLKSCGQIERMLFTSRLQVPFVEFRQVICFEEHILCHALSVRCGTLPMFSFGISSVWLLSERVSMLTKLLRVSSMLGNILILRMPYRSELVSDGYTSITRGRNRTRNVTRYAKAFKDRGSLELTVLYARERNVPKGRKPLDWKLITNMPVRSRQQAIEKLDWYAMRWKIETFHKVLKSGCKAEEALLRTADRLSNLIAIYCILSWRILWLTMFNRTSPAEGPELVFTETEMRVLDAKISNTGKIRDMPRSVERYVIMLARLGGYIGRRNDRPQGNKVIWRGMVRLTDIVFGVMLAEQDVGN